MMMANGLAKLMEECGELTQIAAKKLAYYHTDDHPDGVGSMNNRLMDEMGDVLAAIHFVSTKFKLDKKQIMMRMKHKVARLEKWDADVSNVNDGAPIAEPARPPVTHVVVSAIELNKRDREARQKEIEAYRKDPTMKMPLSGISKRLNIQW